MFYSHISSAMSNKRKRVEVGESKNSHTYYLQDLPKELLDVVICSLGLIDYTAKPPLVRVQPDPQKVFLNKSDASVIFDLKHLLSLLCGNDQPPNLPIVYFVNECEFFTPQQFFAAHDYFDVPFKDGEWYPLPWAALVEDARNLTDIERAKLIESSRKFSQKIKNAIFGPEANGPQDIDTFGWNGPYGSYEEYNFSEFQELFASATRLLVIIDTD